MKNLETILGELKIELTEEQKAALVKSVDENYKVIDEYTRIKNQLKTAQDGLRAFEGVDVNDLKSQIQKLTDDLAQKDAAYQADLAERDFQEWLKNKVVAAGARSVKAVIAELDVDSLRQSKNRDTDADAMIKTHKEKDGWLYGSDEPINNPIHPSNPGGGATGDTLSDAAMSAIRAAAGLPEKKS